MTELPGSEDRAQRPKPLTDFYGENRHELVQNSRTSTGKKGDVRLGRRKLIGSQPKRTCARTS